MTYCAKELYLQKESLAFGQEISRLTAVTAAEVAAGSAKTRLFKRQVCLHTMTLSNRPKK